ncbi:hypothetical protein [Candidatus Uabimicrobium sp. HlEnr_7]|uniref:hypothetical protein n=1 Tax=Candidatus Uabimicrobium helgolandensis TaxID=3095367 RepID=UPI0035568B84
MEFLLIVDQETLPQDLFTYKSFMEIKEKSDQLSTREMYTVLEKMFITRHKRPSSIYFKWTENLSNFYSQVDEDERRIPMFKYWYDGKQKLRIDIPEGFTKPDNYKWNDHPKLFFPYSLRREKSVSILLKLTDKANRQKIKYIMRGKKVFTSVTK